MVDPVWWLGIWEPLDAPGRHQKRFPAPDARGYQYCPSFGGRWTPWSEPRPTMWDRVGRAIPVDGVVADAPPSWTQSPQARYWLEPARPGVWKKFKDWLRR